VFLFFVAHVDNEMYLGRALERLGDAALKEQEPDIGAAFLKFAVVTKELSALMKTLVRSKSYKAKLVSTYADHGLFRAFIPRDPSRRAEYSVSRRF